jgi:membrane-bound serine protease (ClpP class)
MLIDSPLPFLQISWQLILAAAICISAFFIFAVGMTYRSQIKKPTTGKEGLVGEHGKALEILNPEGRIEVHGEIWNAIAQEKIKKGQKVEITEVDANHLVVKVKPV